MRRLQRLVLLIYTVAVFTVSFVMVPHSSYSLNGSRTFMGHKLKPTIREVIGLGWDSGRGSTIDAQVMIAEVISLTAMAGALILFLRRS